MTQAYSRLGLRAFSSSQTETPDYKRHLWQGAWPRATDAAGNTHLPSQTIWLQVPAPLPLGQLLPTRSDIK